MSTSCQFPISPSRLMLLWLCMVYGLLGITLLAVGTELNWAFKVFILIGVGVLGVLQSRRYVWLESKNSVVMLRYSDNQQWHLHLTDGREVAVSLTKGSIINPLLTVLFFEDEQLKAKFPIILLPDSMQVSRFSLLRTILRTT